MTTAYTPRRYGRRTNRVPAWRTDPATDTQMEWVNEMLATKDLTEVVLPDDLVGMTKGQAKDLLDDLFAAPRLLTPEQAAALAAVTPGLYLTTEGEVVKIQLNREKTRMYGKVRDGGAWVYEGGLVDKVAAGAVRITAKDVKAIEEGVPVEAFTAA